MWRLFFISLFLVSGAVQAVESPPATSETSADAPLFGFYASIGGDTAFGVFGLDAALNLGSYLRLTVGVGSSGTLFTGDAYTAGASLKILPLGCQTFNPVLGGGIMFLKTGPTQFSGFALSGTSTTTFITTQLGMDWQTPAGFNVGIGGLYLIGTQGVGAAPYPTPYMNIGYYF